MILHILFQNKINISGKDVGSYQLLVVFIHFLFRNINFFLVFHYLPPIKLVLCRKVFHRFFRLNHEFLHVLVHSMLLGLVLRIHFTFFLFLIGDLTLVVVLVPYFTFPVLTDCVVEVFALLYSAGPPSVLTGVEVVFYFFCSR